MNIKSLQFWYISLSLCIIRPTKSRAEIRDSALPARQYVESSPNMLMKGCQKTIIWKEVQLCLYFYVNFYERGKETLQTTTKVCSWYENYVINLLIHKMLF